MCSKASAQKQQTVPLQKNETGQNCWTGRTGNLPPLSDNHETGNAIHQQCTVVIFRRTKTVCWKSYPYQRYGAMIHIRKSKVVVPVDALMACRKGWCVAPLILKFGDRCRMISFTPRSLCPLERTFYLSIRSLGLILSRSAQFGEMKNPLPIWDSNRKPSPCGVVSILTEVSGPRSIFTLVPCTWTAYHRNDR